MPAISAALLVLAFLPLHGVGLHDTQTAPPHARVPRKGDTITVKGCLLGSMLQSTETQAADGTPFPVTAYSYQLKGKKDLLKELRGKHDGFLVALKGELKSMLADEATFGTQVGNTRVVVGGDPRNPDQGMRGMEQTQPVLEVKSYEGSTVSCRR
jgi:hypothetical protein